MKEDFQSKNGIKAIAIKKNSTVLLVLIGYCLIRNSSNGEESECRRNRPIITLHGIKYDTLIYSLTCINRIAFGRNLSIELHRDHDYKG